MHPDTRRTAGHRPSRLLLTTALTTILTLPVLAPAAALAQDSEPAVGGIEEIVITARRQEESLQTVPVAVTAFGENALQELQAENLSALQGAVPNLNLVQGRGSSSSANVYIRGVGQPDALATFDPAVGIYLGDVFLARIQGALLDVYDTERVEVLRGPQGTLYGKNTIGGAIKLVPKRPTNDLEARAELTIGSYERLDAKAFASGPLVQDQLFFSASALTANRAGFVTDRITGDEYNDKDTLAGRVGVLWTPNADFEVLLDADYTTERPGLALGRAEAPLIQTDFARGAVVLLPAPTGEYDRDGQATTLRNKNDLDSMGVSGTISYNASDTITLKSVTAWRSLDTDSYIDIDASIYELGDVFVGVQQDQTSQEFQLNYTGDALRGVFGLFYLKENVSSDQIAFADSLFAFNGAPVTFDRFINDDLETTSYAVFGQASYDLTPDLSLTLGLRYTHEEKDYFRQTNTVSTLPALTLPTFAFTASESWEDWSPRVGVDYVLSDDVMLYASIAKGFKSGGFNGRANNAGSNRPYDPEIVWTYEVGAKTDWYDNRLRLNLAAFYNDYQDFQARVGGETSADFPVLNAAALTAKGLEVELTALPLPDLTLSANLGYLDAEYDEFIDSRVIGGVRTVIDRSGDVPAFSPEWTMRYAASYAIPVGELGEVTVGADANYRSETYLSVDQFAPNPLVQDGYWLFNARIAFTTADEMITVAAGVKNIGDEVYKTDAQEFSNVGNIKTAYYGDPRTYSLTLGLRF